MDIMQISNITTSENLDEVKANFKKDFKKIIASLEDNECCLITVVSGKVKDTILLKGGHTISYGEGHYVRSLAETAIRNLKELIKKQQELM